MYVALETIKKHLRWGCLFENKTNVYKPCSQRAIIMHPLHYTAYKAPCLALVCGESGSGKSTYFKNVLLNRTRLLEYPPQTNEILCIIYSRTGGFKFSHEELCELTLQQPLLTQYVYSEKTLSNLELEQIECLCNYINAGVKLSPVEKEILCKTLSIDSDWLETRFQKLGSIQTILVIDDHNDVYISNGHLSKLVTCYRHLGLSIFLTSHFIAQNTSSNHRNFMNILSEMHMITFLKTFSKKRALSRFLCNLTDKETGAQLMKLYQHATSEKYGTFCIAMKPFLQDGELFRYTAQITTPVPRVYIPM